MFFSVTAGVILVYVMFELKRLMVFHFKSEKNVSMLICHV